MGNSGSTRNAEPVGDTFGSKERGELTTLANKHSTASALVSSLHLPEPLANSLLQQLPAKDKRVTPDDLARAVDGLLRGNVLPQYKDNSALVADLAPTLRLVLASGSSSYTPSSEFLQFLQDSLASTPLSYNVYLKPLYESTLNYALFQTHHLPSQEHSSLLSVEAAYILRLSLPFESESERMSTWSCVFDSERDGKSWTVFTDRILDVGDVLLIVKDKQNHVFGAFTSNLLPGPSFKESPSSRLFSLSPTMAVYTPTSINKNHVYFNVGAHTLPNGLGFGGQMEYFGLWIGETFEGCSKASPRSTTYDNPMLSGSQDFVIDSIEAWLVKPKEVDDRLIQKRGGKTSVLNTSEAAAMLEMGGHRMYSKEIGEDSRRKEEAAS